MSKKLIFIVVVLLSINIQSCKNTNRISIDKPTNQQAEVELKDFLGRLHKIKSGSSTYLISAYDDLMIEVGESEGQDWRMIAALAYCESRFKHEAESSRGARGIMQIMPIVARQFGVPEGNIVDPQTNIMLAAKLLNEIDRMLKLGKNTPYMERMKFILASYNCGIGHIKDARNLARKYGANPDSWDDVSHYLKLKSNPEVAADEVVRYGRIKSGTGVIAFVNKVVGKYQFYCDQHPQVNLSQANPYKTEGF